MNSSWNARIVSTEEHEMEPMEDLHDSALQSHLSAPLRSAIARTRQWLLGQQTDDGYWVGELEGDTILESEFILLLAYLGEADTPVVDQAARYILQQQMPEGGWNIYPGGPLEISASVKAYFALKLAGHQAHEEHMVRARTAIRAAGGADAVNSFTRYYLALLGQIDYAQCPVVPPEVMLLPKWSPVNLYSVSAWSRTMIVPLSIMSSLRPRTEVDAGKGIRELFLKPPAQWTAPQCPGLESGGGLLNWRSFFLTVDKLLHACERWRLRPLRGLALKRAEQWMVDRFEDSDGLGAIFPPMVWSTIALHALGHKPDSPQLRYCRERLDGLIIEEDDTVRLQPCKSPVWDTAIALIALADSGLGPDHQAVQRGSDWLVSKECRRAGDWSATVKAEPAGWYFEHANDFYPDIDDTIMSIMALNRRLLPDTSDSDSLPPGLKLVLEGREDAIAEARREADALLRTTAAVRRGERWVLAMQNNDGGWGAFDRNNDKQFLCHVPFADHNAMIDPSTPDLAARVLESLGKLGYRVGHPAVDRCIAYLRKTQEADGSWFGRWGINYIYGTWQVIVGLVAVGVDRNDPVIRAGGEWLMAHQQISGAWGESADSYADPTLRGQGDPTASQTAWALLGLVAAGLHDHPAVERGVRWLVDTQLEDGTWDEPQYTGTGFPQVFYLRYHLYRIYFPLMALSRWAVATGGRMEISQPTELRLSEPATRA